jgi:hypothetical protein
MRTSPRARSTLWLALALVIACGVLWLALDGSHEDGRAVTSKSNDPPPIAPIAADVVRAESDAASPESLAAQLAPTAESLRAPAETTAVVSAPPRAGTLAVRACDLTRLGPLRWFNVRVCNATRFAERRTESLAGEIELPLTPGAYSVLVLSPGYESVEIPSVEVPSGAIVRLDSIDLRPGSGRIQVRVIGTPDPNRKLRIELRGGGRHPCANCAERDDDLALVRQADEAARSGADAIAASSSVARSSGRSLVATSRVDRAWNREGPCPDCGYAQSESIVWVHVGENFTFTNLAGGSYALRVADSDGRTIDKPRQLTLVEGETSSVVFDCSASRSIEIELFGLDGQSLTQEWSRRIVAAKSNVEAVRAPSRSEETYEFVIVDDRLEWARSTLVPPSVDGHRGQRPSAFGGRKLGTGVAKTPVPGQPVDRARRANDALYAEAAAPSFAPVVVQCEIGDGGFVTMDPLPAAPLRVRVFAAHAEGEALVPASRGTTRVNVYLHARANEHDAVPLNGRKSSGDSGR